MRKNESPKSTPVGSLMFLLSVLTLAGLLGLVGCGGGGGTSSPNGGGGGGGGGNSPACTFAAPSANGTTSGVGVGNQISPVFFSMHLNSQNAPWPFFDLNGSNETLPFGGQRLWAAGVAWPQVEATQGAFDWSLMDQWLSMAQQHGVDILYTLARTPSWASQFPSDSSCSTGNGECDPPLDLKSDGTGSDDVWIAWVTAVAQHSAAQKNSGLTGISYYEIWNEWNTTAYWNPTNGTTAQLVRMEQDARCVVEGPPSGMSCNPSSAFPSGTGLDPGAKIVSPSPVGGDVNNMLGEVASSLNTYFSTQVPPATGYFGGSFSDAIGFHGYVGTATRQSSQSVPCPTPENVNTVIGDMNQTLASFPSVTNGKPLFNTEGGWSEATYEGFTDPDRQAAFLPRYLLLQESANIDRVYWFAWDSKTAASLYNDTSSEATPAATAYGEVNQWTVGATVSKACSASGTVWTCGFTRPGGYTATAVWDAGQDCTSSTCPTTTYTVPSGGYIEYRDVAGNVTSLNGATTVQVGAKPILLETAKLF